jgi:hypothetical protein
MSNAKEMGALYVYINGRHPLSISLEIQASLTNEKVNGY